MEFKTVAAMAMWLRDAMTEEYGTRLKAEATKRIFDDVVSGVSLNAHTDSRINGKNAELRKLQLEAAIRDDVACDALRLKCFDAERNAAKALIELNYRKEHIKLVRAWLYQEAGTVITL